MTDAERKVLVERFIDDAFDKVSRNPSDWESTTAWRDAISMALDHKSEADGKRIAELEAALREQVGECFADRCDMCARHEAILGDKSHD